MYGDYPIVCWVGVKYFYSSGSEWHHYPFKNIEMHYEIIDGKFKIIGYGDKEKIEIQLINYMSNNKLIELVNERDGGQRKALANYLISYYSLFNVELIDVELLFYQSVNDISDKHNLWRQIKSELISIFN